MSRGGRATGWEENVALALGVGRIGWMNNRVSDSGVRGILTIPCSRGHGVEVEMPTKFPHDVIKKKLQRQGWAFHGSKPVCPACVEADKTKGHRPKPKLTVVPPAPPQTTEQDLEPIAPQPTVPEKEVPMETSVTAIATATAQQTLTPSAKAKAARREVMQWLDESFELTGPEKGRYKAGVTDATIAKESGCSEEAVRKIREEFFGVLDKPKELDSISVEVGNLRMAAAQLLKNVEAAAAEMTSAAKEEAKVINAKADKLAERLAQISREQGWS